MEQDLVSIITPCYNGARFISQYIESLKNQTYKKLEILFINDGSTDESEVLINKRKQELLKLGYQFRYYSQSNQGAAAATEIALWHMNGEYFLLHDVDDILLPNAIEVMASFLKCNPHYGMVRCNGYYVKSDNIENIMGTFDSNHQSGREDKLFEKLLYGETYNWPGSFMIRTEDFIQSNHNLDIYHSRYGQNLQVMLPVAFYFDSYFIDMCLMKYIRHKDSHSMATTYLHMKDLYNGYQENRIKILDSLNLAEDKRDEYVHEINICFSKIRLELAEANKVIEDMDKEYFFLKKNKSLNYNDKKAYYFLRSKILNKLLCLKNRWEKVK